MIHLPDAIEVEHEPVTFHEKLSFISGFLQKTNHGPIFEEHASKGRVIWERLGVKVILAAGSMTLEKSLTSLGLTFHALAPVSQVSTRMGCSQFKCFPQEAITPLGGHVSVLVFVGGDQQLW